MNHWTSEIVQTYTQSQYTSLGGGMERGGGGKRSREERRAMDEVEENICE